MFNIIVFVTGFAVAVVSFLIGYRVGRDMCFDEYVKHVKKLIKIIEVR